MLPLLLAALFWFGPVKHTPHTTEELFSLADKATDHNEYRKAISLYTEAIHRDIAPMPSYQAYNNRGASYFDLSMYDKALADFAAAAAFEPLADPHHNRGIVFNALADYDSAIAEFTTALGIDPQYMDVSDNRGYSYYCKGDFENAIADFTEALALKPDAPDIFSRRASAFHLKGDHAKAIADYKKLIELEQKILDDFAKLTPKEKDTARQNTPPAYNAILFIADAPDDNSGAAGNTGDNASAVPDPTQPANLLAWTLATCPEEGIRDGARALTAALQACELSQWQDFSIIDTLAAAYAEKGDFENAIKFQSWCVAAQPNEKEFKTHLELFKAHKPARDPERRR